MLGNWKTVSTITNRDCCLWYRHPSIIIETGGPGDKRKSGNDPTHCFIENGQHTEKSPGDLRKLDVTQTLEKDHPLTQMRKTLKVIVIIMINPENKKLKEKQLYGYFKRQTKDVAHNKTWKWLRRSNLKRETESLLIAAQNNARRTNWFKAKIVYMQKNSEYGWCIDWDEIVYHIIIP